jgi:pyruvate formate-lyase activating enzyme-like uncharacterized protein
MSETVNNMQSQANAQNLKAQGTDTVMDSSIQTKDSAAQRLQQMANQVTEKASPIVDQATAQARQLGDQAQRQARMVRERYEELQERTGVEVTPQMLVVAAGVLAGVIAIIAIIGRLVGRSDEEESLPVADITVNALPNGKYMLTRIED